MNCWFLCAYTPYSPFIPVCSKSQFFLPQGCNITSLVREREKKNACDDRRCKHKGGSVPFQESARLNIHFAKFRGQYRGQATLPSFKVPFFNCCFKEKGPLSELMLGLRVVELRWVTSCHHLSHWNSLQLRYSPAFYLWGHQLWPPHSQDSSAFQCTDLFLDIAPDGLQLLWSAILFFFFFLS